METCGLVLEGGGMRGLYTAGVLDAFLQEKIFFSYCTAVSAGACMVLSYISRQQGRNFKVNVGYAGDKRYFGIKNFLKTGSVFGLDFIYNQIPNKLVPIDYDAFSRAGVKLEVATTDIETGQSCFFNISDIHDFTPIQASSALPMLVPVICYKGHKLLDGGITSPIPIERSIQDGNERNVIILTQHCGYRKEKTKAATLAKLRYPRYPQLAKAMARRHIVYNQTLDDIFYLQSQGKALVIQPKHPVAIGRTEQDKGKLEELYMQGFSDGLEMAPKIRSFSNVIKAKSL